MALIQFAQDQMLIAIGRDIFFFKDEKTVTRRIRIIDYTNEPQPPPPPAQRKATGSDGGGDSGVDADLSQPKRQLIEVDVPPFADLIEEIHVSTLPKDGGGGGEQKQKPAPEAEIKKEQQSPQKQQPQMPLPIQIKVEVEEVEELGAVEEIKSEIQMIVQPDAIQSKKIKLEEIEKPADEIDKPADEIDKPIKIEKPADEMEQPIDDQFEQLDGVSEESDEFGQPLPKRRVMRSLTDSVCTSTVGVTADGTIIVDKFNYIGGFTLDEEFLNAEISGVRKFAVQKPDGGFRFATLRDFVRDRSGYDNPSAGNHRPFILGNGNEMPTTNDCVIIEQELEIEADEALYERYVKNDNTNANVDVNAIVNEQISYNVDGRAPPQGGYELHSGYRINPVENDAGGGGESGDSQDSRYSQSSRYSPGHGDERQNGYDHDESDANINNGNQLNANIDDGDVHDAEVENDGDEQLPLDNDQAVENVNVNHVGRDGGGDTDDGDSRESRFSGDSRGSRSGGDSQGSRQRIGDSGDEQQIDRDNDGLNGGDGDSRGSRFSGDSQGSRRSGESRGSARSGESRGSERSGDSRGSERSGDSRSSGRGSDDDQLHNGQHVEGDGRENINGGNDELSGDSFSSGGSGGGDRGAVFDAELHNGHDGIEPADIYQIDRIPVNGRQVLENGEIYENGQILVNGHVHENDSDNSLSGSGNELENGVMEVDELNLVVVALVDAGAVGAAAAIGPAAEGPNFALHNGVVDDGGHNNHNGIMDVDDEPNINVHYHVNGGNDYVEIGVEYRNGHVVENGNDDDDDDVDVEIIHNGYPHIREGEIAVGYRNGDINEVIEEEEEEGGEEEEGEEQNINNDIAVARAAIEGIADLNDDAADGDEHHEEDPHPNNDDAEIANDAVVINENIDQGGQVIEDGPCDDVINENIVVKDESIVDASGDGSADAGGDGSADGSDEGNANNDNGDDAAAASNDDVVDNTNHNSDMEVDNDDVDANVGDNDDGDGGGCGVIVTGFGNESSKHSHITIFKVSNDEELMAIGTNNEKYIYICSVRERYKDPRPIFFHRREVKRIPSAIVFTSDGLSIIVADRTGDCYVFESIPDSLPGFNPRFILGHCSMVLDLAINPKDTFLVTCDRDEKVRVNNYPNTHIIECFCLGHREFITSVLFLPTHADSILITISGDHTMRVWNYITSKDLFVYDQFRSAIPIKMVAHVVNKKTTHLAIISQGTTNAFVTILEMTILKRRDLGMATNEMLKRNLTDVKSVQSVAFSPRGCLILTGITPDGEMIVKKIQPTDFDSRTEPDYGDEESDRPASVMPVFEDVPVEDFLSKLLRQVFNRNRENISLFDYTSLFKKKFDNVTEYLIKKKRRIEMNKKK